MDSREWTHNSPDPLDQVAAEGPWSPADEYRAPAPRRAAEDGGYLTDPRYQQPAPPRHYDDGWRELPPRPLPPPVRRRPLPARRGRPRQVVVDEDEPPRRYPSAVLLTAIWYVIPVALYVLWALTLGGAAVPGCVDPAGNPCGAPRVEALNRLVETVPRLTTAVALSLVIALIIRAISATWRAFTIGFASAVVGAGITTVIFSAIAGSSPG